MTTTAPQAADATAFAIGFDDRDRARLHELWDGVLDSGRWTEADLTSHLEAAWSEHDGLSACATSGWSGGALAALEFCGVRGETVLCPSNTFMATPLSILKAGGRPVFVDCNREDLCMSFEDFERKVAEHRPRAVWLVHIGGHIAFDVERIAAYCAEHDIFLHRGLRPRPRRRTGTAAAPALGRRRRVLALRDEDDLDGRGRHARLRQRRADRVRPCISQLRKARAQRRGPRPPDERVHRRPRPRCRSSASTRSWPGRTRSRATSSTRCSPAGSSCPTGMTSGLYKYVVFEEIERSTGLVYEEPVPPDHGSCRRPAEHRLGRQNHRCVPLYYHRGRSPPRRDQWSPPSWDR